jgi:hypothetical protein
MPLTYRRVLLDAMRGARSPLVRAVRKAQRSSVNEWEAEGGSLAQETAVAPAANAAASPLPRGK